MKPFRCSIVLVQVVAMTCIPVMLPGQTLEDMARHPPVSIRGSMTANAIGYHASGMADRMRPVTMLWSAHATASVFGVSVPFSLRLSSRGAQYSQSFNQIGLSPSYRWATAHAGYRQVHFSHFTLAGHTFLGGGLELNPGKLRLGLVYGRFSKSTTGRETAPKIPPTLTRQGYGVRLGMGSDNTFVDVIFLSIGEDSTSVRQPRTNDDVPAAENAVAAMNSRIRLSETVALESELAASIYTTDTGAVGFSLSEDDILLRTADRIVAINHSSELLTAIRGALIYQGRGISSRIEYRRIDPGYRSMGAYFINNDVENFTVSPAFSLFNRTLNLRGSLGWQRDNLRNTKRATSRRTISSIQASYNPTPVWGLDASVSNYGSNQRAGRLPLIDSLKVYQTTRNVNVSPRLVLTGTDFHHVIVGVFSRMTLDDRNAFTCVFNENQATVLNLNYSLTALQYRATALFGLSHNRLENSLATYKSSGLTVGVSQSLRQGTVQAGLHNTVLRQAQPEGKGWTINSSFNTGYQLSRQHTVRFNLNFIRSVYPAGMENSGFNEIKGDLGYAYSWG